MKKKNPEIIPNNSFTEFLLYTTPNGKVKVEIFLRNENIWLTQARIGELFGVDRTVVTKHLQNIYSDGELYKNQTSAKIARVQNEGKKTVTREVEFYNLDAILSVGYRVNSTQATHFRIWATKRLKEYIIYSLDSDITKHFFATVQNKLHFAIIGKTATEIIHQRADSTKPNVLLRIESDK